MNFDAMGAKKGALEEILKIAAEAKANKMKSKFAPPAPAEELVAEAPGEGEAPEGEVGPEKAVKVEVEGASPSPELLEKLLALLGVKEGDEAAPEGGDVA